MIAETVEKFELKEIDKSTWPVYRFDQIAESISERVEPGETDLEIYVGLEHLDPETIHIKRHGKPTDVKGTKLRVYLGDVIFGKRRAYQRKASVAEFDCICSAHAMVLRAKPEIIDPKLFPFFLHSDAFMHRAVDISVGSLSPTINWGTLKKQKFRLPPKDQQAKIAELLWAADGVVENYCVLVSKYINYKNVFSKNILKLNTNKNENLSNWKFKCLEDIAPLQRGFDLPNSNLKDGKYPVCYSNGIGALHEEFMVKGPGVWTGRSGTIGKVFYVEDDFWPHNTSLWVTDFKSNVPKYIYYLYSNLNFEKSMAGTGVPTLNRNDIHRLKASIPDSVTQQRIVNKLDYLYRIHDELGAQKCNSLNLLKSLINNVFD